MARKKKSPPVTAASPNRDRHLAFLAYRTGYWAARFPIMAAHLWKTADLEDPRPDHLLIGVHWLLNGVVELADMIPEQQRSPLMKAVLDSAAQAGTELFAAWGGPLHREKITEREESEPEHCSFEAMLAKSPLQQAVWADLQQALTSFTNALPPEVAAWIRLGDAIAAALDPVGGEKRTRGIALMQQRFSKMQPQPLLDGVAVAYECPTYEQVGSIHDQILNRLQGGQQAEGAGHLEAASLDDHPCPSTFPSALPDGVRDETLAIALLTENPEMSVTQIAKTLGRARTSVYRWAKFRKFREALRGRRDDLPRGTKSRGRDGNSTVDGIDDRRPRTYEND